MNGNAKVGMRVVLIFITVIVWVALFLWLGRVNESRDFWGLMLIGGGLITFFGFLQMPGNTDENGTFRESRIRLAISATLVVAYLIYFGSVVYLTPDFDQDGKPIKGFAEDMLPTLTNLLTITISFYFGSTAAIEIANSRSKKNSSDMSGQS